MKHGEKPIITNSYTRMLKKLEELNVAIDDTSLNGIWQSNCGNSNVTLTFSSENDKQILAQLVNGKQFRWIKQGPTTFLKEADSNSTLSLSYNKTNQTFYYSSSDGSNCEWHRK